MYPIHCRYLVVLLIMMGVALPATAYAEKALQAIATVDPDMQLFCKAISDRVTKDNLAIERGEIPTFYHPEFERRAYRRGKKRKAKYQAFTDFRIMHYGNASTARASKGSTASKQKKTARELSSSLTFLGRKVRLNRDVKKVLACVERELLVEKRCADCDSWAPLPMPEGDHTDNEDCNSLDRYYSGELKKKQCDKLPYHPKRLSGIRSKNSFRGWEFSNHLWGIAIDLDPRDNTCCKCVAKWRAHPKYRRCPPDRMKMPVCFIEVFEKYGFRWLGWPEDGLEDTMHFEFLSDPVVVREEWQKAKSTYVPPKQDSPTIPARPEVRDQSE